MADWALGRLFVRTDRFGGYYRTAGETKKSARPNKGCREPFSRDLLLRHIRAAGTGDVVGAYALTPGDAGTGRWVAVDIDAHGPGDDPARNERYALHLYGKLAALGFRVVLVTWGTGGYHIWVLFDRDVPGPLLHAFGCWLVMDSAEFGFPKRPETFPKQPAVSDGKFGNWLRVPGRHHTRDVFASAFDGSEWVEGEAAVAHLLSLTGDPPERIPAGAAPAPKKAAARRARAAGKKGTDSRPAAGPDVFAAYNAAVALDEVAGWHEEAGHRVVRREPDRVEFVRAGKDGAGSSFNVRVLGGVPVTYNFSTNSGLPSGRGLSPSQVRCWYATGGCDTAAMAGFAATLRAELGSPADPPRVSVRWAETPAGNPVPDPPQTADAPAADAAAPDPGGKVKPPQVSKFDTCGGENDGPAAGFPPDPLAGEKFRDTDLANATRFAADHGGDVRWVADMRKWFVFDGRRWAEDASGAVVAGRAQRTVRGMAAEAADRMAAAARLARDAGCEAQEAAAEKATAAAGRDFHWAKKSQDVRRVAAMIEMARPGLLIPVGADAFDTRPDLLNVPNGTVDLRTGELRPHDRADFLTKLCPTPFDPSADSPGYKAFLAAVLPDEGAAGYARELSGYLLTGEVTDQAVYLFHGGGSNGKGVLLDLWTEVLGDREYAATAPAELVADQGESRHPTERTVLRGARLAACQESEEVEALNAKRVKQLTGGSRVTARGMRENFYSFPPSHKLILATNHLPRVKVNDHATWRRMRVVRFPVTFWSDADRKANPGRPYPDSLRADPGLPDRLRAEAPGVLADMVAHAVEFYANDRRLVPPASVGRAVAKYRKDEDVVGRFLRNGVAGDPAGRVRAVDFYTAFARWYRSEIDPEGKDCPGSKTFYQRAAEQFGDPNTLSGRMVYRVKFEARKTRCRATACGDLGDLGASKLG
ncbi:MAG: hypothetical protein C0501_07955 [Isosphaera sp.]|nr:hypothetical protein [Isosphaera sp.]